MPHENRTPCFRFPRMAALGLLATLLAPSVHAQDPFPASIAYQGQARGAKGQPLEGRFEVEVRVFDRQGREELWRERFDRVAVHGGEFAIELGRVIAVPGVNVAVAVLGVPSSTLTQAFMIT